jgi:arginase
MTANPAGPVFRVPYHIDEYLPDLDLPLTADRDITAPLPPGDPWERLAALYTVVGAAVADAAGHGARPVVVSGDCTTSLGTVAGLQRAGLDVGIVWFDAHGDVQTPETTASGYLGGYPLRLLMGYRPELIAASLGLRPVAEQRVLLVGARDLDPPEVTYLSGAAVRRAEVAELARQDGSRLPDGPLCVHVDLDVIDSGVLPGLRFPAPGGTGPAEVADALRAVLGTGRVVAVDIGCTWYPGHDAAARVEPYLSRALQA